MAEHHVVTIGTFDAAHLGHAALVRRAREIADARGARVAVLAFDPHPSAVLAPERVPARLTRFEDRAQLLSTFGADVVERLSPTPELLATEPRDFIEGIVQRLAPVAFVEGADFRFGRRRGGDLELLTELGSELGFSVERFEPVFASLTDQTVTRASSTMVRWLLGHGRVRDAEALLGRRYAIDGTVARGHRRGRTIGVPTANLTLGEDAPLIPAEGVYAAKAELPGGRELAAAVSIGTNPTFDGGVRTIEAHVLDVERYGDTIAGLPEYGWPLRLSFVGRIRDQIRFGRVDELSAQLHRDIERARATLANGGFVPEAFIDDPAHPGSEQHAEHTHL
ncbi:MAG: riboflavin biosynthesis protein RibF [Planctomycetota bacterium]